MRNSNSQLNNNNNVVSDILELSSQKCAINSTSTSYQISSLNCILENSLNNNIYSILQSQNNNSNYFLTAFAWNTISPNTDLVQYITNSTYQKLPLFAPNITNTDLDIIYVTTDNQLTQQNPITLSTSYLANLSSAVTGNDSTSNNLLGIVIIILLVLFILMLCFLINAFKNDKNDKNAVNKNVKNIVNTTKEDDDFDFKFDQNQSQNIVNTTKDDDNWDFDKYQPPQYQQQAQNVLNQAQNVINQAQQTKDLYNQSKALFNTDKAATTAKASKASKYGKYFGELESSAVRGAELAEAAAPEVLEAMPIILAPVGL